MTDSNERRWGLVADEDALRREIEQLRAERDARQDGTMSEYQRGFGDAHNIAVGQVRKLKTEIERLQTTIDAVVSTGVPITIEDREYIYIPRQVWIETAEKARIQ